jgi:hypothetical protein
MHTEKEGPKPKLQSAEIAPTDCSSSAFVQEGEWVLPMYELEDGSVVFASDYEPAKTKAR